MALTFPFLLIMLGWDADNPEATMNLSSSLHSSDRVCEAEGHAFIKRRKEAKSEYDRSEYKFFCIAASGPDEYNYADGLEE